MKTYKKLYMATLCIGLVSLVLGIGSCAIENLCINVKEIFGFITSILLGIFASALLIFVNSIVGYFIERRKLLTKYHNIILETYNKWGIMEFEMQDQEEDNSRTASTSENNVLLYKYLCSLITASSELVQVKNDIAFVCENGKIAKMFYEANRLWVNYVNKMALFREDLHKDKHNAYSTKLDYDFYTPSMSDIKLIIKKMEQFLIAIKAYNKDTENLMEALRRKKTDSENEINKTIIKNKDKNGIIETTIIGTSFDVKKNILLNLLMGISRYNDIPLNVETNKILQDFNEKKTINANEDYFNFLLQNIIVGKEIIYRIENIGYEDSSKTWRISALNFDILIIKLQELILLKNVMLTQKADNGDVENA
ncbi:MAG: hypothetical protein RR348_01375, partial [Clostridia bacterium]